MIEIIPTVVPKIFADVAEARKRYSAFAPSLHIDIVDGIFAPNKTWMPMPAEKFLDSAVCEYEAHLMVANPLQAGLSMARAGARRVIGHIEAFDNAERASEAFDMWQKAGAQAIGVAILLTTSLDELQVYAPLCDFVHVMTIAHVGKQGIPFDERSIGRVREIRERFPTMTISVDGGENQKNMIVLAEAGATRFCVGSVLSKSKDPSRTYSQLLNIVQTV